MKNNAYSIAIMACAVLALALCALPSSAQAQAFTQGAAAALHQKAEAAIGLLEFGVEMTNPNTGEISRRRNNGLGLVVSPAGLVMTHGHMVRENARPFNITFTIGAKGQEREFEAELLRKPDDVNIAFLQLRSDDPIRLPFLRFAPDAEPKLGMPVMLVGLLGENFDYKASMLPRTVGTVMDTPRTTYVIDDTIRFGYVGAPVFDPRGRAIGVAGYDLSTAEGGEVYTRSGHPLIFHTALFQKYIDNPPVEADLAEDDSSEGDAWLGVFTQPLTDAFAEYWSLPARGGLIISTVVPGSPAAQVGLTPGDVIVEFNGVPIRAKQDREVLDFTKLVRETGAASDVIVRILREGESVEVPVTLGTRPRMARDADEYEEPYFGLTVREITTDVRIALNLAEDVEGVLVRRVESGSAAQYARMRPGVLILAFGDYRVRSIADFREAVERVASEQPDEIAVFARVGAATGFFRLEPRWDEETE